MDIPIKDRKLSSVSVTSIELDWLPEGGKQRIGGMCHIALTNQDGGDNGPAANVFFGVDVDPSMPLQDAGRAVLTRAHAILQRLASFSADELNANFVEWRAKAAEEQKKAAEAGFQKTDRG